MAELPPAFELVNGTMTVKLLGPSKKVVTRYISIRHLPFTIFVNGIIPTEEMGLIVKPE